MLEKFQLFDSLKNRIEPGLLDALSTILKAKIYFYGDHFKNSLDNREKISFYQKLMNLRNKYGILALTKINKINPDKDIIISNAYFSVNQELRNLGFQVYQPPWCKTREVLPNFDLCLESFTIEANLNQKSYIELISPNFLNKIKNYKENLKKFFSNEKIKALFVPNDMGFFENLAIQIFKEIKKPSFIFLHGLPGRYNIIDENRSDYLLVWGESIKKHYIEIGFDQQKIEVVGHPFYKDFPQDRPLKNDLVDILIITKSLSGIPFSDGTILSDRGNSILYLEMIKKALEKLGVEQVRLRPHPSENQKWYSNFIDKTFFKFDTESLGVSLQKASLVIGPTSTVFLEAIYHGVNYIIFEPNYNNLDIINYPLVPPFNGKDSRLIVTTDVDNLYQSIKDHKVVDTNFFSDYIKRPFDIGRTKEIINNFKG